MTTAERMPTVKKSSKTDKLLLTQMIVQEMVETENVSNQNLKIDIDNPSETAADETCAEEEEDEDDLTLEKRTAFLKKPLAERRTIMAEQAEAMQSYYQQNMAWKDWLAGDIVEY